MSIFLTEDSLIKQIQGFSYLFFAQDYNKETSKIQSYEVTVDISKMKITKKEALSDESLKLLGINPNLQLIDPFALKQYLEDRYPNPDYKKNFFVKEKNGTIKLIYTVANVWKKGVQKSKLIINVFYKPENKDLILEFNYYGFFSDLHNGNNFHHKKVFKEKKTIKSTEDFLNHLKEIDNFYQNIVSQTIDGNNLVFHNIRHEKPLTREGFSWDEFNQAKLQV